MGRLSVLANDEEMLLTDLSLKVRKKIVGPKNDFPKLGFWNVKKVLVKKVLVKKVTNIQIVTHPYLARLLKNVAEP